MPVYFEVYSYFLSNTRPLATIGGVEQVRVRVLNVDSEARKLVLSMRQKPRPPVGEQGDVSKYVAMLEEVRHGTILECTHM